MKIQESSLSSFASSFDACLFDKTAGFSQNTRLYNKTIRMVRDKANVKIYKKIQKLFENDSIMFVNADTKV